MGPDFRGMLPRSFGGGVTLRLQQQDDLKKSKNFELTL
jgi:hypothetical protein